MRKVQYQLGIFSWFGYRLHIRQRAQIIKAAGFQATSLWWGDDEEASTGSLHDLPPIVRKAGLDIDNIHFPFYSANELSSENTGVRQTAVDRHISALNDCARHNIGIMVMHVCHGQKHAQPGKYLLDSLSKIICEAEKLGVTIAAENVHCRCCLDFAFSQITSANFGFCYDSSHDWVFSDKPIETLAKYGDRLVTTHLSDNDGIEDRHWFPGDGIVDWGKSAKAFPKKNYKGRIMLELLPKDGTPTIPPDEFIENAYKSLSKILKSFY